MPSQDRGRLNNADQTEQTRPEPSHPHEQRTITAPQPKPSRSSPQGDVEVVTKKEVLTFKPAPRLLFARREVLQDQHGKASVWLENGSAGELRRSDLLDVLAAKADKTVRVALVDDEMDRL